MKDSFIYPQLSRYKTFQELVEGHKTSYLRRSGLLSFDELMNFKTSVVLAEPGFGKTRLLKEMFLNNKKEAIFIDLKRVEGDLEDFIKKRDIPIYSEGDDIFHNYILKNKKFTLRNLDKVSIYLDALDEVKYHEFYRMVDSIKSLLRKYDKISITISCRFHYFQKAQELFTDTSFEYIHIDCFSRDDVRKYLSLHNVSESNIDKIWRSVEFRRINSTIQTPRYLEMLVKIINDKGKDFLDNLSRAELFQSFINYKLEIEDKKSNGQKREIVKRLLSKIALIMEIYQVNLIKKEELINVLDDIKSNLSVSFLSQIPIEELYDRTVLKDNIDSVEFENAEFQEYLAAREIMYLGRVEQTAFDLVVNKESRELYHSWFNTLCFLVDLEPSLLKRVIEFVVCQERSIRDEEYFRFLTKVDSFRLSKEDKINIFEKVFLYYQGVLHWIPPDISRSLAYYFDNSQMELLEQYSKDEGVHYVQKGNVAYIVAFLWERNLIKHSDKDFWIKKLIEFMKNDNGVVKRHSLFALGKMADINDIKPFETLLNSSDKLVLESFIQACLDIDPNNDFTIKVLVESSKKENIYARYGLYEVKSQKAIKKLLEYFVNDEFFLSAFLDQENIFRENDHKLVKNINEKWSSEIQGYIESIIVKAFAGDQYYDANKSQFLNGLIDLIVERDPTYIFRLINNIKKSQILNKNLFYFQNIFTRILKHGQEKEFVEAMKELELGERIAGWVFISFANGTDERSRKIYESGRRFFPVGYENFEKERLNTFKNKETEPDELSKKFILLLEPLNGKPNLNVLNFYLRNRDKLTLTKVQINKLKKLIIDEAFEKIDPPKGEVHWSDKQGRQYTITNVIIFFGQCLQIAQYLNLDISKYRKKIISYIPFAYSDHLRAIFHLVPDPSQQEIDELLKIYLCKRTDDLPSFLPNSFIEACEKYQLREGIPILKRFVDQKDISSHERQWALRVIGNLNPEKEYLNATFLKYRKSDIKLAEVSNEFLITKFKEPIAIKWRFNKLRERSIPYKEPEGIHFVKEEFLEFRENKFAKPLMELKDPSFIDNYLKLLDFSFTLIKKGEGYRTYVSYLWEVVIAYFKNLKEYRDFNYYRRLDEYVEKNKHKQDTNWFAIRLPDLLREYLTYIGKPREISECIKKYNYLKNNQYLDIATPLDLFKVIQSVIKEDFPKFIEAEGFYKAVSESTRKQEEMISKTLRVKLENCFIKRGFRENELRITREEQLYDNKRTDYLISYGFIGPILIEIKRLDNKEIYQQKERKAYKRKLLQYLHGTKSYFGFFIVFRINKRYELNPHIKELQKLYRDCNVEVYGLDCLKSFSLN